MYPESCYTWNHQTGSLRVFQYPSSLWTGAGWLTSNWPLYLCSHFAQSTQELTGRAALLKPPFCHLLVSVFHLNWPGILNTFPNSIHLFLSSSQHMHDSSSPGDPENWTLAFTSSWPLLPSWASCPLAVCSSPLTTTVHARHVPTPAHAFRVSTAQSTLSLCPSSYSVPERLASFLTPTQDLLRLWRRSAPVLSWIWVQTPGEVLLTPRGLGDSPIFSSVCFPQCSKSMLGLNITILLSQGRAWTIYLHPKLSP